MSTKTYKPYKQDPHTFTPTLPIPRCPTDRAMSPPNPNCQAALQELMDHTFKRVLTRDRVPDDAGHAQGPAGTRRDPQGPDESGLATHKLAVGCASLW